MSSFTEPGKPNYMSQIQEQTELQINSKEEDVSRNLLEELIVQDVKSSAANDIPEVETSKIWIPKAICLISTYPFYDFMSGILLDLYYTVFYDEEKKTKE